MLYCTPSLPEACLLLTQLPIDSIPYACVDQTRPAHISNPLGSTPVQAPRGRNCVRSLQIYLSTPATGSVLHPFDRSRDFSLKCINSDFRVRNLLILFKFSGFSGDWAIQNFKKLLLSSFLDLILISQQQPNFALCHARCPFFLFERFLVLS